MLTGLKNRLIAITRVQTPCVPSRSAPDRLQTIHCASSLRALHSLQISPQKSSIRANLDNGRALITEITIEETIDASPEKRLPTISREAYSMHISHDGHVFISILHLEGALRALATLTQFFYAHSESKEEIYTPYAPAFIRDAPVFEHRGLNLDICPNWIPPSDVLRTIEAMALNKLNKLHLHASDAQSWPIEIPLSPA